MDVADEWVGARFRAGTWYTVVTTPVTLAPMNTFAPAGPDMHVVAGALNQVLEPDRERFHPVRLRDG